MSSMVYKSIRSGLPIGCIITLALPTAWDVTDAVDPDQRASTEITSLVWDKPRHGWQVGAKLLGKSTGLSPGDPVNVQLVLRNVSDRARTVVLRAHDKTHPVVGADNRISLKIPGLANWNMNVVRLGGDSVRLDWVSYSGIRRRVTRSLRLAPGDQESLTGIVAEVRTAGLAILGREPKTETTRIPGPTLQVLPTKTQFRRGDPRRLIATQGSFEWSAWITVRQMTCPDIPTVVGSSPVPLEITRDAL